MNILPLNEYWKCSKCGELNFRDEVNCKSCGKYRYSMNGHYDA